MIPLGKIGGGAGCLVIQRKKYICACETPVAPDQYCSDGCPGAQHQSIRNSRFETGCLIQANLMSDRGEGYVRGQLCNLDTKEELKENKGPFGFPDMDTEPLFPLQFS